MPRGHWWTMSWNWRWRTSVRSMGRWWRWRWGRWPTGACLLRRQCVSLCCSAISIQRAHWQTCAWSPGTSNMRDIPQWMSQIKSPFLNFKVINCIFVLNLSLFLFVYSQEIYAVFLWDVFSSPWKVWISNNSSSPLGIVFFYPLLIKQQVYCFKGFRNIQTQSIIYFPPHLKLCSYQWGHFDCIRIAWTGIDLTG